jgi:hypothetical protein
VTVSTVTKKLTEKSAKVVTFSSTTLFHSVVVSVNKTSHQRTSSVNRNPRKRQNHPQVTYGCMELDSHADTIVLGSNAIIVHYTNRECGVSPYADSYEPIRNVPIVTGATAVTSSSNGMTYILIFNEAIWMGDLLDHLLINPNQLRFHGVDVHDNPFGYIAMHIASDDGDFTHPMQGDGTTIFFDLQTPTNHKLDKCPHVVLSSPSEWNPREVQLPIPSQHHSRMDGPNAYATRSSRSKSEFSTSVPTFDMSTRMLDGWPRRYEFSPNMTR